jgi:hypothetical protein
MRQNITPTNDQEKMIIKKIRTLSPEKVAEVLDFVEFISQKDRDSRWLNTANKLAEKAFKKVGDHTEDEVYDRL